jgi:predicted nucleic acid-binding protein
MRLVVDTNILVSATIQGAMTRISKSNTSCVSGEPRTY